MRRLLIAIIAGVLFTATMMSASAGTTQYFNPDVNNDGIRDGWATNNGVDSLLWIERMDNGDNTWTWTYTIQNQTDGYFGAFKADLIVNDCMLDPISGKYIGNPLTGIYSSYSAKYSSNGSDWSPVSNFSVVESWTPSQSKGYTMWTLNDGGFSDYAQFSFKTTLTGVDQAKQDVALGDDYAVWTNKATPAVPEPMSMVLGFMGLSSVAGFTRLRKKA